MASTAIVETRHPMARIDDWQDEMRVTFDSEELATFFDGFDPLEFDDEGSPVELTDEVDR